MSLILLFNGPLDIPAAPPPPFLGDAYAQVATSLVDPAGVSADIRVLMATAMGALPGVRTAEPESVATGLSSGPGVKTEIQ